MGRKQEGKVFQLTLRGLSKEKVVKRKRGTADSSSGSEQPTGSLLDLGKDGRRSDVYDGDGDWVWTKHGWRRRSS